MRWDPLHEFILLHDLQAPKPEARTSAWRPAVDIIETAEAYIIVAEMPGLDPSAVDVEATAQGLVLKGVRNAPALAAREYLQLERGYGEFHRRFAFPQPVSPEATTAEFRDGILTVTVPKLARSVRARIEVS